MKIDLTNYDIYDILDEDDIELLNYNSEGHLKHIWRENSQYHVISYDAQGRHCSELNCEINFERKSF